MSSQKSVRFSPKGERKAKTSKSDRPTSARSDKKSGSERKSSKGEIEALDDSPINSLTTNVASPPESVENFVLPLAGPEPEVSNLVDFGFNIPFESVGQSATVPDKPNLHDLSNKDTPPPPGPERGVSYIQTISYPLEKVQLSDPTTVRKAHLREHPPELLELIQQLEIEHFGKDLSELDIDRMFSVRNEDELRDLTERLHSYISKIRELRNGATSVDARSFMKSVDVMETEMKTFKSSYEREINQLRLQLTDLGKEKSHLQLQNSKLEATASELQNRVAMETESGQQIKRELSQLEQTLLQKEYEIELRLRQEMADLSKVPDYSETNKQLDQTLRENMDLHRRYEAELLLRKENEEKVHQLEQQISFNEELSKQRQHDLQERLATANTAILTLESKVYAADKADQEKHIAEMLATVKNTAEMELVRYKKDVEETYSNSMAVLKSQMTADKKSLQAAADENRRLTSLIEDLKVKTQSLQAEITRTEHAKGSVEERIQLERERATKYIQTMEIKVKELQDGLFDKMKELNSARIQILPLKAEVERLRALVEEEERRRSAEASYSSVSSRAHIFTQSGGVTSSLESNLAAGAVSATTEKSVTDAAALCNTSSEAVTRTVQLEPAARIDLNLAAAGDANTKPVGPIISKAAQSHQDILNLEEVKEATVQTTEATTTGGCVTSSTTLPRPDSVRSHDYNHCTNSSTGDLKIHEVHPEGKSITLINMSANKDVDFGGYILQQQVGGHSAAVFRFPPKTTFTPKSYITVYSGCNDLILHQPPTQFVWKEQEKWGTGPECTTLLCKPNGQAIAWSTAAHRFGLDAARVQSPTTDELPHYSNNPQALPAEPVYLKREKELPPTLSAQRHPHGNNQVNVHPDFNDRRTTDLGSDNSSNHRQTRSQSGNPDKVPGEPYAGPAGQRMGSSNTRRYTPLNSGNIRKNGVIANRIDPGELSENPSPFMTPRSRHATGLQQIKSQHHAEFNPPMPRPPLFSTW